MSPADEVYCGWRSFIADEVYCEFPADKGYCARMKGNIIAPLMKFTASLKDSPADEVYCEGCVLGTGYATCLPNIKSSQLIDSFVVFDENATNNVLDQ